MAIALFLQAIQALTGSQFVKDRLQRSEHVIRVLKAVGIDPEHPPEDFEAVYAYALVEYGYGKPDVCLEIFRAAEIRSGFRRSFDGNDPQGWLTSGEVFLASSEIGEKVRSAGCDLKQELAEFAAAFLKVARRSQTPKETLVQHQLRKIERTIDRKLEQVAGQLEAMGKPAVLSPGGTLALASASCRAAGLADQMRRWFEVLGYHLEPSEKWEAEYFEWVINIPKRRGFDRVLVRGIVGEVGVKDVMGLRESVAAARVDEGWVVTARRISKAARAIVESPENADLFCFTFDEFLDQDADFEGYATWLMGDIEARGIEARYVPLACTKEEVDAATHQRLGVSRYGESDGWTEGYVDLWLDDPVKEHLSILGEFGTGKTWLTLHYAAIALRKYQTAKAAGVERPRLPIVIPLRDYAKAVSVESLFSEFFFRKHEIPIPGYSAFEELNRMGKLLLIFDGFDEMAARVDKQQMINNFWELAKVVVPGSKVILTCRTEHFPEAKEGRSLLNAELQASTRSLSGETPQFEVLELEKFEDSQIRSVLLLASSAGTVEQVMGNPQLLDLARRPVMTELILEALPDIEAGKPVDMSRVYLYAVKRKMSRDIRAERTFTSMADKLYFLCELSWEMLSNDRMSINYREFPDRIRTLFGSAVQEERDLDHWHYDMMGQTMLIRNSDGDYTPAHRSLLEFFVAFKFAAELGALAPDFLELAQMKSGIDRTLEPRDYTWSEYFGGGAVAPLKGFVTEKLEVLRSGFGKEVLSKAVVDLFIPISFDKTGFISLISIIREKSFQEARYIGGNLLNVITSTNKSLLEDADLSYSVWNSADLRKSSLRNTNFTNSDLSKVNFRANLGRIWSTKINTYENLLAIASSSGLYIWNMDEIYGNEIIQYDNEFCRDAIFNKSSSNLVAVYQSGRIKVWDIESRTCLKNIQISEKSLLSIEISEDKKIIAFSCGDGNVYIWDSNLENLILTISDSSPVWKVKFSKNSQILAVCNKKGEIRLWELESNLKLKKIITCGKNFTEFDFSIDGEMFAIGGSDGDIEILDTKEYKTIFHKKVSDDKITLCLKFSPDNTSIFRGGCDNRITVWNFREDKLKIWFDNDYVRSISFREKDSQIIFSTDEPKIMILKSQDLHPVKSFYGHDSWIWSIEFLKSSNLVAYSDNDWNIWLLDYSSMKHRQIFSGHTGIVSSIKCHPNGKLMASSGTDGTTKMWCLETGECTSILKFEIRATSYLIFSPDGRFLLKYGSYSDWSHNEILIWDFQCKKEIRFSDSKLAENLANLPYGMCFHMEEPLIAVVMKQGIGIWNLCDLNLVNSYPAKEELTCIASLKFLEKNLLACGSVSGIVYLLDFKTGEVWQEKSVVTGQILEILFISEQSLLVVKGNEKKVYFIYLDRDEKFVIENDRPFSCISINPDNSILALSGRHGEIDFWNYSTRDMDGIFKNLPYEGMNITGVKGLSEGTIATLKALGAVEDGE